MQIGKEETGKAKDFSAPLRICTFLKARKPITVAIFIDKVTMKDEWKTRKG
jgi:hypothetical protein